MTHQEINEAIAEHLGWHVSYDPPHYQGLHPKLHQADDTPVELPDYCNDLNAMHEAEKAFANDYQREEYAARICNGNMWRSEHFVDGDVETALFATAAQRAEAFLKTLNLWK